MVMFYILVVVQLWGCTTWLYKLGAVNLILVYGSSYKHRVVQKGRLYIPAVVKCFIWDYRNGIV